MTKTKQKMNKKLLIIIFAIVSVIPHSGLAQSVQWSVSPAYSSLEEYAGSIYKIRENGKVGLADISGRLLIPASYDSITPFTEKHALALDYEAGNYAIKGIINQFNFNMITVNGNYYISKEYPFFSEGKLVIYDANGLYGYLKTDGSLFKECEFYKTYPFYWERACTYIKTDEGVKVRYLKEDGSWLRTELEKDSYILHTQPCTSFNEDGLARIGGLSAVTKSSKIVIINKEGNKIKMSAGKYKERKTFPQSTNSEITTPAEDGINPIRENLLYGYINSQNDIQCIPAQFTEAYPFRGGYAKVKHGEKYGVLKLIPGTFSGQMPLKEIKITNNKSEKVTYAITTPPLWNKGNMELTMDDGKGNIKILEPTISTDENQSYSFNPMPVKKEKAITYKFSLRCDGLLLLEDTQTVSLHYINPITITVSELHPDSSFKKDENGRYWADINGKVIVCSIIENKTTEPVNLTVTIGGDGLETKQEPIVLSGKSQKEFSIEISNITQNKDVNVFIQTSNGVKRSNIIKVKPFY